MSMLLHPPGAARVLLVVLLAGGTSGAADRVSAARVRAEPRLRERFAKAQVVYPPQSLFLRVLKRESFLELWAGRREGPLRLVHRYPICAWSGGLGPKRAMGDQQVPEGFYVLDRLNPVSNFHLSLRVSYPNASDAVRGSAGHLGGDIYVHGNCVSIGCVAIRDEAIEEVYLAVLAARGTGAVSPPIHIFPQRLDAEGWKELRTRHADRPELIAFWEELVPPYQAFEESRRVPRVETDGRGRYRLVSPRPLPPTPRSDALPRSE